MKRTILYDHHVKLGARMVAFAGFEMPLEYEGVRTEHQHIRENAGVFDISHMGEIWIKGPGSFDLVQKVTGNDLSRLKPGKIQYSCLHNHTGGIVDDLLVYCYEDDKYMLVVNAANREKDYHWIVEHNDTKAVIQNASGDISQLAVQGPNAISVLQELTPLDLSGIPSYNFHTAQFAGAEEVIISNSGYTGSGGFELYMYNRDAIPVWERLFEVGEKRGLIPAGLAARDTLRLEMGYCLYGNDIDETTSPIEAGLGWITKFSEENHFIGREELERQKSGGIKRRLVGFEMEERGIPRQHYPILDEDGHQIGRVTSGTMSPTLNRGIGMGYVDAGHAAVDTRIRIGIRSRQIPARIVRPPFYKPGES